MSSFATVAQALARWPQPFEGIARGAASRLLAAMEQVKTAPTSVGSGDLAGLVGQVLREEMLLAPGQDLRLMVPTGETWPDRAKWEQYGVEVTFTIHSQMQIRALPWLPDWLQAEQATSPIDATLRQEHRRTENSVVSDPVWTQLLNQQKYLSPGQRDAVRAALLLEPGQTLLVLLPTGGGKSMVAYSPALLEAQEGATTILVVPTVALALDQERRARELFSHRSSFDAPDRFAYYGGLDPEEKRRMKQRIAEGKQPLVIASPESVVQALRPSLLRCAENGCLRAIVLDEAHLVSQWGNEFRPEFQAIAGVRRLLLQTSPKEKAPRTILMTATLTQEGWRTLKIFFGSPGLKVVAEVYLRSEADYFVSGARNRATRDARVIDILRFAPRPLILYTSLREETDRWFEILHSQGFHRIGKIHGGTPAEERNRQLIAWSSAKIDVMVATSAFGLGMDKADVRTIVHACVPETLDRYYQEVGRGGRDGQACLSFMIYEPGDLVVARSLSRQRIVGVEKGFKRWKAMYDSDCMANGHEHLLVSLDSRPSHIQSDSDANIAWNLRTLVLMARAGLLEFGAFQPPILKQGEDEPNEHFEKRQQEEYERYALRIAVQPTGLNHLDPRTWEQRVHAARQDIICADRRSFEQIKRLIAGQAHLTDMLVSAYTLDEDGVRVKPSRANGLSPEPILATSVCSNIGERLKAIIPADTNFLLVATPPIFSPISRWRGRLLRIVRLLVVQGVREVRAPKQWLDLLDFRDMYRYARPRIVFFTELYDSPNRLSDQLAVPRLTIFEGGRHAQDLLADVRASPRPLELLFVPEDLSDPVRPDRRWIEVNPHILLSQLQEGLD